MVVQYHSCYSCGQLLCLLNLSPMLVEKSHLILGTRQNLVLGEVIGTIGKATDVGYPSLCYEYASLTLVNKEFVLAYGRTEYS